MEIKESKTKKKRRIFRVVFCLFMSCDFEFFKEENFFFRKTKEKRQ